MGNKFQKGLMSIRNTSVLLMIAVSIVLSFCCGASDGKTGDCDSEQQCEEASALIVKRPLVEKVQSVSIQGHYVELSRAVFTEMELRKFQQLESDSKDQYSSSDVLQELAKKHALDAVLHLRLMREATDKDLRSLSRMTRLNALYLFQVGASNAGLQALAKLQNIDELYLHKDAPENCDFGFLLNLPRLQWLRIELPKESICNPMDVISQIQQLQSLEIYTNGNRQFKIRSMKHLQKLVYFGLTLNGQELDSVSLEQLDVPCCIRLDPESELSKCSAMQFLRRVPAETELSVSHLGLNDSDLSSLHGISAKRLNLAANNITEHGLAKLIESSQIGQINAGGTGVNPNSSIQALAQKKGTQLELDELDHDLPDIPFDSKEGLEDLLEAEKTLDLIEPASLMEQLPAASRHTVCDSGYHFYRARLYILRKDFQKAIPDLDIVIRQRKLSAVAYKMRGYVELQLGKLDLALQDLNRAIELEPTLASAFQYRAQVLKQQGRLDLMEKDAETAEQLGS